MYSPKIKPKLIPVLYVLAKDVGKPMTEFVSDIIEEYLLKVENEKDNIDIVKQVQSA